MRPQLLEDKLESVISGCPIFRYDTLSDFIEDKDDARIEYGDNGAKILFKGIFELVGSSRGWHLRRFKSVCGQPKLAVQHDELLLGDGGEHCQLIWNPGLGATPGEEPPRLAAFTSAEEQRRIRDHKGQSVMDVLAFL